jgi:putative transcriptional regulator
MPAMDDPVFFQDPDLYRRTQRSGRAGRDRQPADRHDAGGALRKDRRAPGNRGFANLPVSFGGPVQTDRGFVLHRPVGHWQSTLVVNQHVGLTSSRDILQAVGRDGSPREIMVTLGYAGWGAGQLEHELAQNAWLTVPAELPTSSSTALTRSAWRRPGTARRQFANLADEAGHA